MAALVRTTSASLAISAAVCTELNMAYTCFSISGGCSLVLGETRPMAFVYGLPLCSVPPYASNRAKLFNVGFKAVMCFRPI